MIAVSNTSPLNYLTLISAIDLLPQLFGTVAIPSSVLDELSDAGAPPLVQKWIAQAPGWLRVHKIEAQDDASLQMLHRGEREAILLAEKLGADLLILDEQVARTLARQRGLRITGTLGVLNEASARGLVDITESIHRLRQTTFRAAPTLYKWLLDQHRRRAT